MSDELARSAMYAMQALVGAMRDADLLSDRFIEALDRQTDLHLNYAAVLGSPHTASPPDPDEARAIRHGMWWLRECAAPTGNYYPAPVIEHPKNSQEWQRLEERIASETSPIDE